MAADRKERVRESERCLAFCRVIYVGTQILFVYKYNSAHVCKVNSDDDSGSDGV